MTQIEHTLLGLIAVALYVKFLSKRYIQSKDLDERFYKFVKNKYFKI
jgi:hypothetical protein